MSLSWREAEPGDFAVIGDPVAHSKSPAMHQAAYAALGLPYRYTKFHVGAEDFEEALAHLARLGYQGINCTLPHKEAAFRWCDQVDEVSRRVGAVNTLRLADRHGINTDAPGFLATLLAEEISPGAEVTILGAGGSARTLIIALSDAGYRVSAWNRTPRKLQGIEADFSVLAEPRIAPGTACLINATSASLAGDALPLEWGSVPPHCLAYDLAYGEGLPFLVTAAQHGLRVKDGRAMLVEQGALAFAWWIGKEPPRSDMLQATHEHPGPDA